VIRVSRQYAWVCAYFHRHRHLCISPTIWFLREQELRLLGACPLLCLVGTGVFATKLVAVDRLRIVVRIDIFIDIFITTTNCGRQLGQFIGVNSCLVKSLIS
ncbi:unnamed protein product, partial [Ectocarpus sp. 6 AP-2014]